MALFNPQNSQGSAPVFQERLGLSGSQKKAEGIDSIVVFITWTYTHIHLYLIQNCDIFGIKIEISNYKAQNSDASFFSF